MIARPISPTFMGTSSRPLIGSTVSPLLTGGSVIGGSYPIAGNFGVGYGVGGTMIAPTIGPVAPQMLTSIARPISPLAGSLVRPISPVLGGGMVTNGIVGGGIGPVLTGGLARPISPVMATSHVTPLAASFARPVSPLAATIGGASRMLTGSSFATPLPGISPMLGHSTAPMLGQSVIGQTSVPTPPRNLLSYFKLTFRSNTSLTTAQLSTTRLFNGFKQSPDRE